MTPERTQARRTEARRLRSGGATYRAIAAKVGVSHTTARKYAPFPRGEVLETPLETPPFGTLGHSPFRPQARHG